MTQRAVQRTTPQDRRQRGDHEAGDEELACAAQAGSLVSFEVLVHRYQDRIFRYLWKLTGDSHSAEDLAQDTFVRAYRQIAKYKRRYPFGSWVFTIARNLAASRYRALAPTEEFTGQEADAETPYSSLVRREESTDLWDTAKQHLPEAQFTALWLRYADSMSVKQIASAMGKTEVHARILLFRARQTLAAKWATAENRAGRKELAGMTGGKTVEHAVAGDLRGNLQSAWQGG